MTLASSSFTTLFGRKRESFSYTLPMERLVNLYAHYYGLPSLLSVSKRDYSTFTYSSTPELK